jgi:hypothetical protein
MKALIIAGALLSLAACTTNPGVNASEGAVGGAAMGCGIGALMTAPAFGVGCIPGAIAGGMMGGTAGLATTPPPPVVAAPPPPPYPGY